MSISRKFQRSKSKYTLSQKIISAVTAAGFIMQPIVGFAQSINKVNNNGSIEVNGNVTNIWADKVVSNSAVNVFKDFQLDANNIANMYFNTKRASGADAANLVNFVNSRIDINGTVNAIQNSQIGGNLFFLSKDGMAVGKSGVINTGSLYVMTPTQDFMDAAKTIATTAPDETAADKLAHITNITTDAASWQAIPLNSSGTITVLGKVNAVNEVRMRAAKIGVGKNVDDSAVDNVAAGEIAAKNAHIETGITDFSNIVNINYKDESGKDVAVNSGITNLTATKTGSGDIVLEAYVDASDDKNAIEKLPVIGGTTLGTTAESVENTFTEQEFAASVDIYGKVNATGKADISATAINSNADFDETLNDYKANNNDVAQLATVKADVNIGGTVKAADDVNIKAEAVNRYVDNTGGFAKALSVGISSGTPLTGDVAYSVLDTEANVNVASGANVESEKGSVDIDAKAETLAASAASTTGLKFKAAGGLTGANVPATAVVYTGVDNKANVTVEGNIKAGEDISIDADADMKVEADNKMSLKGEMANQFVVGVTVAGAENSASVDIKGTGNEVSASNDLSVNAKADSDFTSSTSIKAPEASAITVAVNVTDFNSNANVNVNTDLTAGNNLNVAADNTIVSDNVNAETKLGSNKYISAATQVITTNAKGKITEVKNFINGLKTKLGFEAGGSDDIKTQLQLSEILKAGATVTYSGQEHKSGVNIGKNGSLTAQNGMLGVNAETLIEDAHIAATGTTYSYNDAYPAGATLNASVLVNNMDNSSSVVVADREEGSADALKGKNGVSVNASTRFEYNRIKNMIQDVKDAYNQIETATESLGGAIETDFVNFLGTLQTQIESWEIAFATADETLATSDSGVLSIGEAVTAGYNVLNALNNLNTMLDSTSGSEVADATKASIQGASDLLTSALAFADPNSYGNFAASSASKGSSGNQSTVGGHIPSAINGAGTVIVNNVDTVSKVEIGSNTGIASDRDVNINAESFMKDVTLGGLNFVPITNSGGGTTASIGATVNYSDFNTDTIVAVNDGANISGGDINIAGSNVIDHVSVAGSAGVGPSGETQSGGIVLNGMLSFVNGSSDILTVVDDGANLTAKQNEYTETVKDEETGEEKETKKDTEGNISITGHNNSNIVNVAAGLNFGTGSGAVGVGLAYTDFAVKNIAGVADVAGQINNLYSYKDDNGEVAVDDSKVAELDGELNNTYTATASTDTKGSISAYGFNVDAATDGSIQSVSAAASANKNDDTGKESFFGKLKGKFSNVENKVFNKLDEQTGQIFGSGSNSGKADEMFNKGSSTHDTGDGIKLVGSTSGKGGFMPSFSIAGSGSVSLNSLNNATEAVVDNVNITMQPTSNKKGDISVTARDTLYAGAYSGAAALQWKKGGSADNTSVGFSGAAGVNDIDNAVKATIKNSTISNAGKIDTMALSGGEQLALGLGLAVVKADGTSGVSGNAAVSVNLIDHDVEALLENNTVTNANDINVAAYARDIENTGGGTLSAGQQKVGVGATVAVAQLNNNISAGIKGGSYTDVGNVDVDAMNALKNITVGIAAGATVPSGGDGASAVVEGAGVYNEVHNTTNAFIEGNGSDDKVVITTVDGGIVDVIAQDVAIAENSIYEQALDGLADGKTEIAERMGSDFDITGESELNGIETDDIKAQLNNKEAEGTATQSNENSTEEVNLNKDSGSSIITVAGGLAATTGKGAGGAAVAITDIENNYTANVEYAQITAEELNAEAGSDSNIVTVSGGIAAASKGSGVGSVTWNDVENTANVNIVNSSVKAQQTAAKASNTAQIVSVAGQISGAGKAGVGATLSYIGLDNSTEANITNTRFDKRDQEETEGITVTADAENSSDSYNIAAGVSAAVEVAVSGNVAVTQTHGTSGAVIDGAIINNAKAVSANALDDTDILSVIGTVSAAGNAAIGAGVAYTEIGGVSDGKEKAEQHVTAEINNSEINSVDAGSTVSANAEDTARVYNIAIGVGGAGNVAVQGASATTLINKETSAGINSTNIDAGHEGSTKANVTVDAQNSSEITSSADVAAAAGSGAGVGAGIAVNRIIQQTNATVNGGTMNINNLTVNANAAPRIENIGIGAGVAGTGAGVTGSVAVNMIENDVAAHIGGGANIVADDNVGVVATSDEQIANYVGSASVAGTGAAVGASVSVNKITGTTSATVGDENKDTKVTAKGNGSDLTSNTIIDKNTINNALIDNDTVDIDSHIARGKESRKGLIVDASSTRDMKSFLINASVAGEGAGVTGTVNVNMIDGATEAGITDTVVNGGSTAIAGQNANVFVNAGDYTNSSGFVGGASVAGIGGGVGLASDTNTVERTTSAIIEDSDIKADKFEVDADSMQGVSSFTVSAGVAGIGAGVSGVVSVTDLKNTTQAAFFYSKVTADTVDIKATHKSIINAGNVGVGAAGLGAGVGLSVGVLKDNSETRVDVGDNEITLGVVEESEINAEKDVNVAATNNAVVKPVISATGAGAAGAAGAISINNINSVVKTNINHADINSKQGNITGNAQNAFDIDAYMGGNAAGAFGSVGVSVTVNTIDSTIQTNVTDSELTAENGDITLTAEETRNIEQIATNVSGSIGVSAGANIAITNVGEDVENDENSNAADKIAEANNMYSNNDGNDIGSLMGGASDALNTARINDAVPTIGAGYGGDKDSQITVNITGSDIDAGNNVTAKATETDNITMTVGGASGGAVAAAAGVGILNVHRNVGVDIDGGSITAGNAVNVGTDINGEAKLNVYQGSGGVVAVNAAYAGVKTTGSSDIDLSDVTIAGKNISIAAQDNAKTDLQAVGVAAGVAALGALAAEAANDSDVSVNMTGTTVTANEDKDDDESGKVEITTNKANTVTAQAVNTAGGAIGGTGMGATVTDTGSSTIGLTGNTMQATKNIDVNAKTNSALQADIISAGAGWFASGAVSIAKVSAGTANDHLKTAVTIGGGNTFAAQNTNFAANSNISESMDMDALAISGYASIGGNSTTSDAYADATVTAEADNTYKGAADNAGNVSFNANNTVTQKADTSGISAAGLFATGTNIGTTTSDLKTAVTVKGSGEGSKVNNFNANASSYASVNNKVNGDGGAIADISPYAAKVDNNYTADTDVTIGGTWNTAGSFTAQAVNGMDIDLTSEAVRAAVIGGSGTWLDNTINNAANVTVNGATINSGGAQSYTAQNDIDYTGKIDGSGYGGINVNATDYSDDLDFSAGVDIKESTLHGAGDGGSITAFANTQGNITTKNSLKSAGVIPVALAFSDHAIDYDNRVNVVNSDLTTDKADADITLAATDDTDVELETIADTQGGVAGAASAEASNAFNRGNKINIDADSDLLSTKDINLYAGADANGTISSLNLQVLADAYNKTAIPVYTDPTVNNSMTQSNQIELAGNAESVRHINASAAKGFTTVTESAKEYKVWTGTGGEGNVASTALGDQIKNETADNYINVTGTAKAGVHNKLDITIDGHSSTAAQPTYEERPLIGSDDKPVLDDEGNPVMEEVLVDKGDVSYKDVIITVDDGEETDWFNKNQITPDNLVVVNGLMERYNQVMEYLAAYAEGSEAYEAYEKEKNLLLTEMLKAGLAERDGNNNIVPLDYIDVPAISLPDIVVSGGNINLETDTLKGSGEITAQGAPQISITNNSDLYLKVQDVTISDNGGNVYLTGNKTFTGKWQEDGTSANTPTITIHGGSGDESQFTQYGNQHPQADIGIFGDITNTAGDVKIINDNYSILVDGNVSGRNIQITATRGNVTQQSSSGVLNVGNDPITKLQFSEAVAEKIQKYLHSLKRDDSKEFKDYTAYLDWLINTVGITLSELGYAGDVNNITGYTKTWNEVLSAVAQKEGLSDTNANAFLENKKKEGFNAYVSYLNELGIGYKYNAAKLDATISEESAGILAGGNIYIDAVNVNIGGLIQSGYGAYSTKLTADDNTKVEDLDKEWQANKVALTDNDVLGNSKYLINGGGEVYNTDTHVWDYEVKVYYNPATGQLLTESVRPEGGNIQISGKVSSTGGGRIMAMDGTSNVNINTAAVDKDVKVNSITVNDITGLISITDKNVTEDSAGKKVDGWVTEYKNGQWREYAYGTDASSIAWQTGVKDAYKPVEGTQFAWTGGASGEVIREKHYTEDFLFWGALSYNTSEALLDHLEQIGVDVEGTVISSGSSEDPTPMKDGSLITDGYKGGGNMFRIDWTYTNPQNQEEVKATDPTVKKKYDGVAGKIFGYGEYTYTWTETTGDQMASTTGIKADNTIQIGFLGNGEGNGDITVNSGKDMLLNGNISNATVVNDNNDFEGRGSVTLNSNNGSVSAIGSANINSDDVNIKAATGVDVNHAAIGDTANINVATDSGDISFVSSAGDLNIEQMITGITYKDNGTIDNTDNIDASTGSVYLEAQGNILDAGTGTYAVKGQRIDLVSHTGNIGALDDEGKIVNALRVLGGSELYSNDTMASSVNAQANGDIVLTQTNGNMRLGTINSENGDAVLTVNNGSFVDAHPSENNDNSSAQDKIDRWLEAGLISDEDKAGESTNAAKEAKKERMDALDNQADSLAYDAIYDSVIKPEVEKYQEAADAFAKDENIVAAKQKLQDALNEAGDNEEQIAAANAEYQQAVDDYFAGKDYNADEQQFIADNDTAAATKYVFDNSKGNTVQSYKDAAKELAAAFANNADLQAAKDTYLNDYKAASAAYSKEIAAANGDEAKIKQINKDYQAKYDAITNDYLAEQAKVYGDGFSAEEQQLISSYAEVNVDESNYGWSKNQLLYAIQDSVLNTGPGEVQTVGTPNVTANNITLNAANGGIGIDGAAQFISNDGLNNEKNLKILAAAKAGDLTWGKNVDGVDGVTIRQQQAITVQVKQEGGKVDVTGKDNVYLAGVQGTELNVNGITTTGDIRLQGDEGVIVDGTLTGVDLTITGGTGDIMGAGSDDYVDTNISGTLDANAEGSIYISQNGDLKVLAVATNALADLKATNNILMSDVDGSQAKGYINAQTLNLTATGGSIGTNVNAIRIADNGVVINASATDDIVLAGVTGNPSADSIVLGTISGASLDVDSVSNVSLGRAENESTEETEGLASSITTTGDAAIEAAGDINLVNGTANIGDSADDSFTLTANGGSITQNAAHSITANNVNASATGNILLGSDTNKINSFVVNGLGENNSLNGNVELTSSSADGLAVDLNDLTVNNGYVNITNLAETDLNISGGSVTTTDKENGSITVNSAGSITADTTINSAKDILLDADGAITNTGNLTAENNVNVTTTDGDVALGGSVTSNNGYTHISAGSGITEDADGNVTVDGEVACGKEVIIDANDGNVTITGTTTASDGDVDVNVTGDGDISLEGSVNASGNVKAEVTGTGDITTSDNAEVNSTDIEFTANKGNITTGSSLTAKENVDLNTNTGDITFGGDVTASDGNITININEAGNLKDVLNTENTLSAFSQDGDDAKGNIYINIKGIGDVDLSEIYADNDARLDIANGNLALGTINGELVAIQLRTEDKDMNVGEIIAGTQIVLTGSDMTLDQISQRPDVDGMLVITPDNAEADKPIDNFTIGDIKTNADSGIRFDRLWVNNSDIHISEGQLWFDKLYVEDNAHFSNDEMSAAIYGKPPLRDGSDSVYWINTEENRPESSLDMWLNGTGDWMYLRFTDDHIQESNGILLTLDEYDYVYDQRFTAENHLRWQHGRYLDEDWKQAYGYGLSLHNRYGLIDYQEFTETNAGADEVAVEA